MESLAHRTFPELLNRSLRYFADYPALSLVDGEPVTYRDLVSEVRRVSAGLRALGIAGGDRVALVGENMPNWAVAYLATTSMGAIIVPLLPDFSATEIRNILDHAQAKVVFVSRTLSEKTGESDARVTVMLNDFDGLPDPPSPDSDDAGPEADDCDSGRRQAVPSDDATSGDDQPVAEDDTAAIIYTSGTTGRSKGVMLTHANIISNAEAARPLANATPGECALSILPLAHTYECTIGLIAPLSAGMTVYYLGRQPSPSAMLPALATIRPHLVLAVPMIIEKIYRAGIAPKLSKTAVLRTLQKVPPVRKVLHRAAGRKLFKTFGGRLRFFGLGGAPIAPDVEKFLQEARFPYGVGYGLTETSPLIAASNPAMQVYRAAGPAVEGVEIRLADADPETGEGEIQVRGPNVMRGYYRDPERTDASFSDDGWFRTGDLGTIDGRKRLFIRGRLKNVIVEPSGKNIYPEELEALINARRLVAESLVVKQGQRLVALVNVELDSLREQLGETSYERAKQEATEYLERVRAEVNAQLSSFAQISRFVLQEEPFEKTPTMKIKRYLYDSVAGNGG